MKARTIASEWQRYRADCVPLAAGREQRIQTCFAFYAGFDSMLQFSFDIATLTDAEAVEALEAIHREMHAFRALLEQGGVDEIA